MNTITTIVKFGSSKHCFLSLVESYSRRPNTHNGRTNEEVVVYEASIPSAPKAFFSVHSLAGELTSGDVVELNGLYADKLGLKDGDPLLLRKITAPCPRAKRVFVEPVSEDDWEILRSNAGRVEMVLLDHVRVVWSGQVIPIWIQRSLCVFMKINKLEPTSLCVVLETNTEIVVSQKERESRIHPPPNSLSLPSPLPQQHPPQQMDNHQRTRSGPSRISVTKQPMLPPQESLGSPCRNRSRELLSTSDLENVDTLEPRPIIPKSPSRSPRNSQTRRSTQTLSRDNMPERVEKESSRPVVKRQSSLMESVMRYIFPSFVNEYRMNGSSDVGGSGDSQSDSDAGSAIDYSLQNLPSRSSVLRVQPLALTCTQEECLPNPRSEVARHIQQARTFFEARSRYGNSAMTSNTNVQQQASQSLDLRRDSRYYHSQYPSGDSLSASAANFSSGTVSLTSGSLMATAQALDDCDIPGELFQPSTIYVDAEYTKNERLLHPYLPHLPHNFIARLTRIPSPREKAATAQKPARKKTSSPKGGGPPINGHRESVTQKLSGGSSGAPGTPVGEREPTEMLPGKEEAEQEDPHQSCFVRVVAIDRKEGLTEDSWQEAADKVLSGQPLLHGHVLIPDLLRRQLRLDATNSVWLQTGTVDLVIPRKVCIFPLSSVPKRITREMIISAFRHYIKQIATSDHPLVVFQGLFLKFMIFPGTSVEAQITFLGENDVSPPMAVTMLSELNIESVLVTYETDHKEDKLGVVNPRIHYVQAKDIDPQSFPVKLKNLGGVTDLAREAMQHLLACVGARPLSRHTFRPRAGLNHGLLLITGPRGAGKTALVKGLCRKLSHLPVLAYILMVDCKTLRGKTVSNIQKAMEAVFDEAAWREPSVIVLDNLDAIAPAPSGPETEMNGEALYSAKNSQILQSLIKYEVANNSRVTVIATCLSQSALHPSLVSSRGVHYVQKTLNIGNPCKTAREQILRSILQQHSSVSVETLHTVNLATIALKTEGYVARDLESLVNRALHGKLEAHKSEKLTLTDEDFELALCSFKPVSIRSVALHKAGDLGWCDVGGLDQVKRDLVETLLWPTKYPSVFDSCPLRLRSGILLYGAPGTGKTLLAGVVAKECALNFISIKGPELLSKYIGASEQAVRDLFSRAQSAKPCILFFDEFDSIAPRRGHDNTGVTDRVVNQLLTQLDGVEGLQGVYVLGATSRPDLIDPALLRPGRLDKCIKCDLPDKEERCAILNVLTRKMTMALDVRLDTLAGMCKYFTGADLKALLYNAQLKAIHEHNNEPLDTSGAVHICPEIGQCDVRRRASSIVLNAEGSRSRGGSNSSSKNGSKSDLLKTPSRENSKLVLRPELGEQMSSGSRSSDTKQDVTDEEIFFSLPEESGRPVKVAESPVSYPCSPQTMKDRAVDDLGFGLSAAAVPNGIGGSDETMDVSWSNEDYLSLGAETNAADTLELSKPYNGEMAHSTGGNLAESKKFTFPQMEQKVVSFGKKEHARRETGHSKQGHFQSHFVGRPHGGTYTLECEVDDEEDDEDDVVDGHGFTPTIEKLNLNFIDDADVVDSLLKRQEKDGNTPGSYSQQSQTVKSEAGADTDNENSKTLLSNFIVEGQRQSDSRAVLPGADKDKLISSIADALRSTADSCSPPTDLSVQARGFEMPGINVVTSSPKVEACDGQANLFEGHVDQVSDDLIGAQESPVQVNADPAQTYPPATNRRRMRSFQRNLTETEAEKLVEESAPPVFDQSGLSVKGYRGQERRPSPSYDRPVMVIPSLEAGLAKLSSEDEARYLAMVKSIQQRDKLIFSVANDRRRTSLQLTAKPTSGVLVEVCMRHLMEAAKGMRPSVSEVERNKYLNIYEKFMASRKGDFDPKPAVPSEEIGNRATLA